MPPEQDVELVTRVDLLCEERRSEIDEDFEAEDAAYAWRRPAGAFGFPESISFFGATAAPFLAGVSVTLMALSLGSATSDRGPIGRVEVAVPLLLLSGILFVLALQCAGHARTWRVSPSELREWVPEARAVPAPRRTETERAAHELESYIRTHQRLHTTEFLKWATLTTLAFNLGIILLLGGLLAVAWPPSDEPMSTWRLATVVISAVALAGEVTWVAKGEVVPRLYRLSSTR